MALRPENNTAYWPLLLTDDLYLFAADLGQASLSAEPAASAAAGEEAVLEAAPPADAPSMTDAPVPQPDLLWGSLERGVLVLVDYPQHQLLDRPDGLFLVEILKAVGFDFKSVATLNISRCKTDSDWAYVQSLPWQYAVAFGIQHPQLSFTQQEPQYQKIVHNGRTVLLAERLSEIRVDQGRKKQLWNLLRQAFV